MPPKVPEPNRAKLNFNDAAPSAPALPSVKAAAVQSEVNTSGFIPAAPKKIDGRTLRSRGRDQQLNSKVTFELANRFKTAEIEFVDRHAFIEHLLDLHDQWRA